MTRTLRAIAIITVLAATSLTTGARLLAGRYQPAERLRGRAVDSAGVYVAPTEIFIDHWSTEQEQAKAIEAMRKGGPNALLTYLESFRVPKGYVITPGVQNEGARALLPRSWSVEFAQEVKTKDGRRVIVASRQHLPIGEDVRDTERDTHELNFVEIRFDKNGKGIGKIGVAGKVDINKSIKAFEIAKYDTQPTRLIDVTLQH
jgi:hypothetical protein